MMKYYLLQIKRCIKILPYIVGATLVLFACVLFAFYSVGQASKTQNAVRFKLGIVGSADDSYLMAGLEIVQSYDSSRFAIDTVQLNEQEAIRALRNGRIDAYVIIPEEYIGNAMSGNLEPLKYVCTTGKADLTVLFKDEITVVISDIVIACEQAMYGVEDTLALKDLESRAPEYIADISISYLDYILEREDMYSLQILGLHDALGLDGYLFCGVCVTLVSLLLLPISSFAIKSDYSFEKLVMSKRIGALGQVVGEYGAVFTIYIALYLLVCLILSPLISKLPDNVLRFTSVFDIKNIYVVLGVLFALSSMSFMLLQFAKNIVSGVLVHFFVSLVLCFVSGCLYPLSFFPDVIQFFGKLFPQYYCRTVLAAVVTQEPVGNLLLVLCCYGLIMLIVAVCIRGIRLRKE